MAPLRCFNRIDRKRCRGEIERGMANCHVCGCDLEGMWKEFDILTSPGGGFTPPKRPLHFGEVRRLGKRIRTYGGVEVPPLDLRFTVSIALPFDPIGDEDPSAKVVSMEHARRRRFRSGKP